MSLVNSFYREIHRKNSESVIIKHRKETGDDE